MRRLVRDRALSTWRVPGAEHQVRPVRDADEHRDLLTAKLIEECGEVVVAKTPANLREELGDVLAVLQGIASRSGISWESVVSEGEAKAERSGGFVDGLVWDTALATAAEAEQDEPLIDPDCRDGKCHSCVGGPCEHDCHRPAEQDGDGDA
ncbi:nucleoside triphosphate pyrophosphohydrolase [Nonomuraea wenchangensis]|uniref:nucleoside triphosphate pyrophosphohydrolase n=1 Tax=Nonomuraea wenchangensis TaxID=568860 RepID=UPI00331B0F29